ncbi:MAG: carbon-nitrogen hydrolase family protein [Planctomycetota bacterium]
MTAKMTAALVSKVFFGEAVAEGLTEALREARSAGADLALLPELPLNPWSPASKTVREEDAEDPGGPRQEIMRRAAHAAGIALLGGAIVRDAESGRRFNTALLYSAEGNLLHSYRKVHVPEEEGFWESNHYEAGEEPPVRVDGLGLPLGIQICSDINRPEGCHILGASGASLILAPRATELATYQRWRLVFRGNAMTSCSYILSVNRPAAEQGVKLGGASVAIDPNGEVLLETEESMAIVELSQEAVDMARTRYPGYLAEFPSLYARGWANARGRSRREEGHPDPR